MVAVSRSLSPGLDRALIAGLVFWNVLQNTVPRRSYGWLNGAGAAAAIATGRSHGLSWSDLGLGPGSLRRGARLGGPLAGVIAAVVVAAAATPAGLRLFRDERVELSGSSELAREVLFRIPVGTVLFEEIVFRGLVLGRLARGRPAHRAAIASSALFGLWHVIPTLHTTAVYRGGALRRTPAHTAGVVAFGVVGSAIAGAGLSVLRIRSRSLAAPLLVHGAINVMAYMAAWRAASVEDEGTE